MPPSERSSTMRRADPNVPFVLPNTTDRRVGPLRSTRRSSARSPRLRVGRDVLVPAGAARSAPKLPPGGRDARLAPVDASSGSVLPRPPRERRAVARRGDGDRIHEQVRGTGPGPRTTADRPARRRAERGPERYERGDAANHGSATDPAGAELRAARLHRLNGGQHGFRHNRRRRSMPPAHELTAPAPAVPALAVPRVAVRYRVALGGARAHRADLPRALGADLRPVGVDHLGPRDPAPRPRRPPTARRGSRCRCCSPRRSRSSAASRRTCGCSSRAPARIAGVVLAFRLARRLGGVPAGVAAAAAPTRSRRGRCATRRWATPRACSSRSCSPRSTATSPAPAPPSGSGSAPRCCAPRPGRFSASTGLAAVARARARAARRSPASRRCRCCGCCPSGGARATRCAPCTARRTRARTARPSPRTRSARCSRQFAHDAHARRCGSGWARSSRCWCCVCGPGRRGAARSIGLALPARSGSRRSPS